MHPVLASVTTVVSFLLIVLYALALKPVYEAEAVVYEQPEAVNLLSESSSPNFDSGRYDSFLQEQIQTMQRADTVSEALATLPRSAWASYGPSQEKATQAVLASLKVARVTTSYHVALTLKGPDPVATAEVVNAIAETYLGRVHTQARSEIDERAAILGEERVHVAAGLKTAQQEQSAISATLGVANPNGEGDPYEVELAALREQLVQSQGAHDAVAAQLTSLTVQGQPGNSALASAADDVVLGDAGLIGLKSSVNQRRATLRGQMSGMTPENPLRQRDQEELAELDHSLVEMTATLHAKAERDLQEKLRLDLHRTADVEGRIRLQLAQRTAAATSSTPKLQRAAELNTDLKRLLLRQAEIDDALRSLQLQGSSPGVARLALAAQIPRAPERSRKRMVLLAAFPLALFFGAIAAAAARGRDPRVYCVADVESVLGFSPIASVPGAHLVPNMLFEEDLLRLAGSIETACRTKAIRTFLLTAVSSHTDIEHLSRALLERFRQIGIQACRTTTGALLLEGGKDEKGSGDAAAVGTVHACAQSAANARGFANESLELLLTQHSLILIEAATLVDSAEAEYIARCTDATILIAECEHTTRADLKRAVDLLQHVQVSSVGIVLQGAMKSSKTGTTNPANAHVASERATPVKDQRSPSAWLRTRTTETSSKQRGVVAPPLDNSAIVPSSANKNSPSTQSLNKEVASQSNANLTDQAGDFAIHLPRSSDQDHAEQNIILPLTVGTVPVPAAYEPLNTRALLRNRSELASSSRPKVSLTGQQSPSGFRRALITAGKLRVPPAQPHIEEADPSEKSFRPRGAKLSNVAPKQQNQGSDPSSRLGPVETVSHDAPDAEIDRPVHFRSGASVQQQTSRTTGSPLRREGFIERQGRLTRQWGLLSRFQQNDHSLLKARLVQQTEETTPRAAYR